MLKSSNANNRMVKHAFQDNKNNLPPQSGKQSRFKLSVTLNLKLINAV